MAISRGFSTPDTAVYLQPAQREWGVVNTRREWITVAGHPRENASSKGAAPGVDSAPNLDGSRYFGSIFWEKMVIHCLGVLQHPLLRKEVPISWKK